MKNLLLLSIEIGLLTLGIWLIYNEYSFRRRAVAVEGSAAGFGGDGAKNYQQEIIFICPFTKNKRTVTRIVVSEEPQVRVAESVIKVYVSPESPHSYRFESPMYFLGYLAIAIIGFGLVANSFR